MPKKKTKQRANFADFLDEFRNRPIERELDYKEPRKYFLIVTEGEKTEPQYFEALKKFLPQRLVQVEISGIGVNTVQEIEKAIDLRIVRQQSNLPDFDEVWAVFDKDDFPNEHFNKAIILAKQKGVNAAYSNEAFELWYVLHFQYLDTGLKRYQYLGILQEKLGSYHKNQPNIYHLLQEMGDEQQAIKFAYKLCEILECGNPALENPTTKVNELVAQLNRFKH